MTMTRRRAFALRSLPIALAVVLTAAAAPPAGAQTFPVPPVHRNDGPAPFLTTVLEPENEKNVYVVQVPTKERLAEHATYFDVPFAVNVPFEIPFEGGPVRIWFDVVIESAVPGVFETHLQRWEIQSHGLYRMDFGDIPAASVYYERQSERLPLRRPESTFPLLVNASPPPSPDTRSHAFRATYEAPRPPFQRKEPGVSDEWEFILNPIVLDPPKAGWYVFWFSLQPYFSQRGWFSKIPDANDLDAKITASVVVARTDRGWGGLQIASLFGRAKRPDMMVEDKLVRVVTREAPVKILRDGWLLDRVEVVPKVECVKTPTAIVEDGRISWTIRSSAAVNGPGAELAVDAKVYEKESDGSRKESGTFSTGWTIRFPDEFPDGAWADVVIGGWRERVPENLYPKQPPWGGFEFWSVDPAACRTPSGAGPDWLVRLVSPGDKRSAFMDRYGASPHLHAAFVDQPWKLPERGDKPYLYRFLAASPHAHERSGTLNEKKDWPPFVVVDCEAWDVKAHYRRKKDVRPAGTGGGTDSPGTTVVDEEDPFWPWFVTFAKFLEEKMADYHGALLACGETGVAIENARRSIRNLSALLVDTTQPEVMQDRIAEKIEVLTVELRAFRDEIDAEAAKAEKAIEEIRAEIDRGRAQFGLAHQEIEGWRDEYRDLAEKLPVEIALLERDEDRLTQVLEAAAVKGLSAPARIFEASVRADHGDVAGAVAALRSAVTVAPDDPEAVQTLQRIECELLKTMLNKSQTAIDEGRRALYGYLEKRGFKEKDKSPKDSLRWYHFLTRPLHAITSEEAWAGFSTGLLDLMGGALGTPGAIADVVSAREAEMARAFLGLHLMLRLRMRGVGFDEMRTMKTEEIFGRVPLRGPNGEIYPIEKARTTAVCLREAMLLPDVKALMDGDWEGLKREMARGYWNERDVRETGAEWIGDIFSMKNTILFGVPMSVGRVAGTLAKVGYWGARTQKAVSLAQELKMVQSGTEVLARLTGWARLVQAVGTTRAGAALARTLEASYKFEESLSTGLKISWTVQKVVAAMVIQGGAVSLSEHYGGPGAALMMEALLILSTDSELLLKALRQGGGSPQAAAKFVTSRMIPALEDASGRVKLLQNKQRSFAKLEAARQPKALPPAPDRKLLPPAPELKLLEDALVDEAAARREADRILDKLKKSEALSDEDRFALAHIAVKLKVSEAIRAAVQLKHTIPPPEVALLRQVLGGDWRKRIPRGVPEADLEIAILAALEDVQRGQNTGAKKAAASLGDKLDELDSEAQRRLKQAKKLADDLGSAPHPPPKKVRNLAADLNGWIEPVGSYQLAEEALDAGRYAEAKGHYERCLADMLDKTEVDYDDVRREILKRKMRYCDELLADATPIPKFSGVDPITEPFDEAAVDEILSRGFRPVKQDKANSSVMKSADGKYFLKELDCSTPDNLAEAFDEAEGELIAYELGRRLGLDMPATTVRVDRVGDRVVSVKILSKAVGDGKALKDCAITEAHKYRSAMSRFKAFSAWLGDWDRHLGNYIPAGERGRLFSIDHGYAGIRKHRVLKYKPDAAVEDLFEGEYGRDHFLERAMSAVVQDVNLKVAPEEAERAFRALFAEQQLTYNAAEDVVREIQSLVSAERRAELDDILADAFVKIYGGEKTHKPIRDLVQQASQNLRTRGQRVEDLVKGFNDRNGIELPASAGGAKRGCRAPSAPRLRPLFGLAFVARVERRAA